MKTRVRILIALFLTGSVAKAALPVFDTAVFAQQLEELVAMGHQYDQMREQYNELRRGNASWNGVRNMASLARAPGYETYLPRDYRAMLERGFGTSAEIRANKALPQRPDGIEGQSAAADALDSGVRQAALNRAIAEEAYRQASNHVDNIRVLTDRIDHAPDAKDIADLHARISAEQLLVQNEGNRLASLQQLQAAQRDLANQRSIALSLNSIRGQLPPGW